MFQLWLPLCALPVLDAELQRDEPTLVLAISTKKATRFVKPIKHQLARVLGSASMAARSFASSLLVCTIGFAQIPMPTTFDTARGDADEAGTPIKRRGLQLYRVQTSGSYMSHANPVDQTSIGLGVNLNSDVFTQTSAMLGWTLPGAASDLTIVYAPTYNRSTNYPEWNRLNHFFSLHGRAGKPVKKFGRWSLDLSTKVDASNFETFLFTPTAISQSVTTPGTLTDLRGVISQRQFVSGELASTITNVSAMVEAPAQLLFYGSQVFTASAVAVLQYSYSPRLSLQMTMEGTRFQPIHSTAPRNVENFNPLVFRSTSVGASVGMNYNISPKTIFSWTADSKRIYSPAMDAFSNTMSTGLSRTIGRRWFVDGRFGLGFVQPVSNSPVPTGLQYSGGGSIGYKMRSHTLLVDVTRSVSETLAFGAGSSVASSAAWRWEPVRSKWSFDTAVTRQKVDGLSAGSLNSWRGHARLSRMIGRQLMIYSQYSRLSYDGNLNMLQRYRVDIDGVQVSLAWLPLPNLFRR